jgi:hypothetical protein
MAPPSDAVTIRIYPTPIGRENAEPEAVQPLLVPFPQIRASAGRLDRRGLITRLQIGVAVHLLRAYAVMRDGGMSVEDAVPVIERASPLTFDYVGRIARTYLREAELPVEAVDEFVLRLVGPDVTLQEAHFEAARLCSIALTRAARIYAATDEAVREEPVDAERRIHAAFESAPVNIAVRDLMIISVCANVNAVVLWPQNRSCAPAIEIARFAAKLILDGARLPELRRADLRRSLFLMATAMLGLPAAAVEPGQWEDAEGERLIVQLLKSADEGVPLTSSIYRSAIASADLTIGDGEFWRSNIAPESAKPPRR